LNLAKFTLRGEIFIARSDAPGLLPMAASPDIQNRINEVHVRLKLESQEKREKIKKCNVF